METPDRPARAKPTVGMLVHDVARLMRRHFDRNMAWSGLGQASWRILVHVAREPGIRAADLAEILEVRPITVGRQLAGLEEAGLIERRVDPLDARARRLHPTRKARPLIARMEALAAQTRERSMAGLSAGEQRELLRMLTLARDNILQACREDIGPLEEQHRR